MQGARKYGGGGMLPFLSIFAFLRTLFHLFLFVWSALHCCRAVSLRQLAVTSPHTDEYSFAAFASLRPLRSRSAELNGAALLEAFTSISRYRSQPLFGFDSTFIVVIPNGFGIRWLAWLARAQQGRFTGYPLPVSLIPRSCLNLLERGGFFLLGALVE